LADYLPPLVASLVLNATQFKAGLAEAGAVAKAETTGMGAAFSGLASVGKVALFGTAAAVGVIGAASIKMAGDFEAATNRLATSAGEQQANIGQVRTGLLQMAGEVGDSAMDLAGAYYVASSAGYNFARGGLDVVRAAAEGAKAEGADLKVVTDAVTSAMIDYHQPASAAALVTSQLVAAVGQGKTTFQGMTGSLHSVLPDASAAHIAFTEIIADVASMTVHGMSADQATQDLDHTIQHLTTTTAPQNKELALLGLNARDLSANLGSRGLAGTLQLISDRIRSDMGPSGQVILQMQTALQGLPPSVQKLGAAVIDGSMSLKEFTSSAKGLNVEQAGLAHQFASLMTSTHGIGSAQQSGAQIAQNYTAALKAATGDSTTLSTALMLTGENASYTNNAIKNVSGATTEAGNHVAGWASIQATLNQHLDKWKYGLEAGAITLGTKLIPYVIQAMGAIEGLVGWLGKNQQVSIPLAIAMGSVLVVAIGAYTVSMAAAAAATIAATWPLLLIIAAVALVAVGIYEMYTHWSQIAAFLGGAWKAASTAAGAAFSALGTAVHNFLSGAGAAIGGFFSRLGALASRAWAEFARHPLYWVAFVVAYVPIKLNELFDQFVAWAVQMAVKAFEWANKMIDEGVRMALQFIAMLAVQLVTLPYRIGVWLGQVLPRVNQWASDMEAKAFDAAVRFSVALLREWNALPGQVWNLGGDIIRGIVNGMLALDSWAVQQAKNVASGLLDGAKAALGISSPSAVMAAEVGVPIAQGIGLGITQGAGYAHGALRGLVGGMTGGSGAASVNVGSGAGASSAAPAGGYQITFNLYGCTDPVATAAAVDSRLSRLLTAT